MTTDRAAKAIDDPRFWAQIAAVLLMISIFVFGLIVTQLISINAKLSAVDRTSTRQEERIGRHDDDIKEMRTDIKALQKADIDQKDRDGDYRFKIGNDLTAIKTKLGIKKDE